MTDKPGMTAPHDRVIDVRTVGDGQWVRVKWDRDRFVVIEGDGSWVREAEVELWREAPHPPTPGIGTPRS